jgi:transposase
LVNDRIRTTNRLRNTLKQYYPQPLEWFDRIDTRLFCNFITRWPTLRQVKRARRTTLTTFFHQHSMRFSHVIHSRVEAIKTATPLTLDEGIIGPHRLQAIAELAPQHPDYALFDALPGAGPSLAPRLLVAFGEQRDRFNSAGELQRYAGIAPVTERSGKKHWVHWRWQCSSFLRQTFVEWAAQTINKSYWAGVYYRQQRDKGATYQAAVRALAFKWIRIVYRCWQTHTPYNEITYLNALHKRGSPLVTHFPDTINA